MMRGDQVARSNDARSDGGVVVEELTLVVVIAIVIIVVVSVVELVEVVVVM